MSREEIFAEHKRLLFALGYRMMGTVDQAEDLVQEAYLRFHLVDPAGLRDAKAYLVTVLTRLAIDLKRSAYERKRSYVGPWLPEPLVEDFEEELALRDTARTAFLLMLEALSPLERAVFLLREVFDFGYQEIADIVEKKTDYCRKIAERARNRLRSQKPRYEVPEARKHELLGSFQRACAQGDLKGLLRILAEDVRLEADGGGLVPAALRPILGSDAVAGFVIDLAKRHPANRFVPLRTPDEPALYVVTKDGALDSILQFDFTAQGIAAVYALRNPEKLKNARARLAASLL